MAASQSDTSLISVVMPVYNRAAYVGEAIQSILAQTYPHLELIVVDDGSTDDSGRIVQEWAQRDVRVRPQPLAHGGVSRAMNAGVAQAHGEWVARMDSDDIALPHRLATQLDWMQRRQVDVCGSCLLRFDYQTGPLWFPETHAAIHRELLFRLGLPFGTMLTRTEILRAHPCDENAQFDDYELTTRLASRYRLGNVPQLLLKMRCHPQQSNVVARTGFVDDLRTYRRRCFDNLFPGASPAEWNRFVRIAEGDAFDDPDELQRAGEWLMQLARVPDRFMQQRTAMRWRKVCFLSCKLGPQVYPVYQAWLSRIDPRAALHDEELQTACRTK